MRDWRHFFGRACFGFLLGGSAAWCAVSSNCALSDLSGLGLGLGAFLAGLTFSCAAAALSLVWPAILPNDLRMDVAVVALAGGGAVIVRQAHMSIHERTRQRTPRAENRLSPWGRVTPGVMLIFMSHSSPERASGS